MAPVPAGTVIKSGGRSGPSITAAGLGDDVIEGTNRHGAQELDLADVDAKGALELGAESGGCAADVRKVHGKR